MWRDSKGRFRACRVRRFLEAESEHPWPGAPVGEIANQMRRKDLGEGCPRCTEDMIENASEPDVMARWR
jgi:hypothetical protein